MDGLNCKGQGSQDMILFTYTFNKKVLVYYHSCWKVRTDSNEMLKLKSSIGIHYNQYEYG